MRVSDAAEDVIGTIRAGARGYVTKTITGPELVDAIGRVAAGDAVFSPRLAGFVLDAFAGSIEVAHVDEDLDRLTEREREVMRLIARGYAYREVASELFISIKTVETHMSVGAAQAPAVLPARADPLGQRAPAALAALRTARPAAGSPRAGASAGVRCSISACRRRHGRPAAGGDVPGGPGVVGALDRRPTARRC